MHVEDLLDEEAGVVTKVVVVGQDAAGLAIAPGIEQTYDCMLSYLMTSKLGIKTMRYNMQMNEPIMLLNLLINIRFPTHLQLWSGIKTSLDIYIFIMGFIMGCHQIFYVSTFQMRKV